MSKIRLAIAGVGNCANSLIQGLEYYKDADPDEDVPGLMHVELAGYHVRDLDFVCAFDVDAQKVGTDLSKAIFSSQNNTIRFAEVSHVGVTVQRGPALDGLSSYYRELIVATRDGADLAVASLSDPDHDLHPAPSAGALPGKP